jgi:uncharacterized protein YbjT (DUF2867 family)
MKILVLGAAGKTGRKIVKKALSDGYAVTAFVRNRRNSLPKHPNLQIVVGDARSDADLIAAMKGRDAVVSALGSIKTGDALIISSTNALIRAARATGTRRIVMLSSFLVAPNYKPDFIGRLVGGVLRGMVADKSSGEELLKRSGLDWTIIYATSLDKAPAGQRIRIIEPAETVGMKNGIARQDVADFLLSRLKDSTTINKALVITTK